MYGVIFFRSGFWIVLAVLQLSAAICFLSIAQEADETRLQLFYRAEVPICGGIV